MPHNPRLRKQLIDEAERLKNIAEQIVRAKVLLGETTVWPDHGPAITGEGIEFYDLVDIPYEDAKDIGTVVVTWAEIDNPTILTDLEARVAAKKTEDARRAEDWERGQYEKLKAKFDRT